MVQASPARRPSRLEPIATSAPLGDDGSGSFTPSAVVTGVPPFTGTAMHLDVDHAAACSTLP